jgi:hypothetical protein
MSLAQSLGIFISKPFRKLWNAYREIEPGLGRPTLEELRQDLRAVYHNARTQGGVAARPQGTLLVIYKIYNGYWFGPPIPQSDLRRLARHCAKLMRETTG